MEGRKQVLILLKNSKNASTRLSMNGKSPLISTAPPFVLRLSKDERRIFQQNQLLALDARLRTFLVTVHAYLAFSA
jgi:hypothetical protein